MTSTKRIEISATALALWSGLAMAQTASADVASDWNTIAMDLQARGDV